MNNVTITVENIGTGEYYWYPSSFIRMKEYVSSWTVNGYNYLYSDSTNYIPISGGQTVVIDFLNIYGFKQSDESAIVKKIEMNRSLDDGILILSRNSFYNMEKLQEVYLTGFFKYNSSTAATDDGELGNLPGDLFRDCYNLEKIVFSDTAWQNIEKLGDRLCDQCNSLTFFGPNSELLKYPNKAQIIIPPKVSEINEYTFCGCSLIQEFHAENNEKIFEFFNATALAFCTQLTDFYIGSLKRFENPDTRMQNFANGTSLKVHLKNTLDYWYYDVENIRAFTEYQSNPIELYCLDPNNSDIDIRVSESTFASLIPEGTTKNKIQLGSFFYVNFIDGNSSSEDPLTIPDFIIEIGDYAFKRAHIKYLQLMGTDSQMQRIGNWAFKNINYTPNELGNNYEDVFINERETGSLIFPEYIEFIGAESFYNSSYQCSEITINNNNLNKQITIGTRCFFNEKGIASLTKLDIQTSNIYLESGEIFNGIHIINNKNSYKVHLRCFAENASQIWNHEHFTTCLEIIGGDISNTTLTWNFNRVTELITNSNVSSSLTHIDDFKLTALTKLTCPVRMFNLFNFSLNSIRNNITELTLLGPEDENSVSTVQIGTDIYLNKLTSLRCDPNVIFTVRDNVKIFFNSSNLNTFIGPVHLLTEIINKNQNLNSMNNNPPILEFNDNNNDLNLDLSLIYSFAFKNPSGEAVLTRLKFKNHLITNTYNISKISLGALEINRTHPIKKSNIPNVSLFSFILGTEDLITIPYDMVNILDMENISNLKITGYDIVDNENLPDNDACLDVFWKKLTMLTLAENITKLSGSMPSQLETLILPSTLKECSIESKAKGTLTCLQYNGTILDWSAIVFSGWDLITSLDKDNNNVVINFKNLEDKESFINIKTIKKFSISTEDNISSIGSYAFSFWDWLEEVKIEGIESIGKYAFLNSGINSATITNITNNNIGKGIFQYCNQLKEIALDNIQSSQDTNEEKEYLYYYFQQQKILDSITLDTTNIMTLPTNTFKNINTIALKLEKNGLTTIEENALSPLTSLTSLIIPTSVGKTESSFGDSLLNLGSLTAPLSYFENLSGFSKLNTIKVNSVDYKENETFSINWNGIPLSSFSLSIFQDEAGEPIKIPNGFIIKIKNISNCPNLTTIDLSGVSTVIFDISDIANVTFAINTTDMPNLKELILPEDTFCAEGTNTPISTLLGGAFKGPKAIFEASGWSTIEGNSWNNLSLYGKAGDELSAADGRYTFASNGVLTFLGFCPSVVGDISCVSDITINFDANIEKIPNKFMKDFTAATSVHLEGDSITTIGSYAFAGTGGLSFKFPCLTMIEEGAFNKSNFANSELTLSEADIELGTNAFSGSNLKKVTLYTNNIGTAFTGLTAAIDGSKAQIIIIGDFDNKLAKNSFVTFDTTDIIFKKEETSSSGSNLFDEEELYLNRFGSLVSGMFEKLKVTDIYTKNVEILPSGIFSGLKFSNIYIAEETDKIYLDSGALQGNVYYEGTLEDWLKINFIESIKEEKEEE